MISLELWRARIGTFNNKRCSGCSLSSLLSSSLAFSSANCRHRGNFSQEEPTSSSDEAQISSCSSSLPVAPNEQLSTDRHLDLVWRPTNLDHHAVSISTFSSSSSRSSQDAFSLHTSSSSSFWSSSSYCFPCDQVFSHLSLLREAFITLVIAIIAQLLLIAGDIEANPGPKHGGENEMFVGLNCVSNFCLFECYKFKGCCCIIDRGIDNFLESGANSQLINNFSYTCACFQCMKVQLWPWWLVLSDCVWYCIRICVLLKIISC